MKRLVFFIGMLVLSFQQWNTIKLLKLTLHLLANWNITYPWLLAVTFFQSCFNTVCDILKVNSLLLFETSVIRQARRGLSRSTGSHNWCHPFGPARHSFSKSRWWVHSGLGSDGELLQGCLSNNLHCCWFDVGSWPELTFASVTESQSRLFTLVDRDDQTLDYRRFTVGHNSECSIFFFTHDTQ